MIASDITTNNVEIDYSEHDDHDDSNELIIGIDLGTTNTCAGIWRNGNLEIIPDEFGNRTIPSFVAYTNISRYVGESAKKQKELNSKNVFYEVKRLIGRKLNDPFVEKEKEYFSYDICGDENNNILLKPDLNKDKCFTPEEISAAILAKVKQMAQTYLKKKITKCIITIPANFNDGQRQATKDAAMIAGLECLRLINEPTSAALAYGLLKRSETSDEEKHVIVYDFGGGTLDVSLLNINNGLFTVLSSCGNMRMGGSDFDNRLMSYCIGKFEKQYGEKIINISSMSLQNLRLGCEQAKKLLSNVIKTQIAVKNFYNDKHLLISITRSDFEKMCSDLFLVCLKPIDDVLKQCEMKIDEIDEIILVGGMTRMPKIKELLKLKFGKEPNCSINPEEAIAAGAAIQGFLISNKKDAFSQSITILDVTSLSLGVETDGGLMDVIIERGSGIPISQSKKYSTDSDYVSTVLIKIYEGERMLSNDNFFVGEFELTGLELVPRGIPEIEVNFSIDSNGIIVVTAENKKTNDKTTISVTSNKGRLTKEKIEELIAEAEELEVRDSIERNKRKYYSKIDKFCNNILQNINNKNIYKLTDDVCEIVKTDIKQIIEWLKSKKFDERECEEYETVITKLRREYGVLIIKGTIDNPDVKDVEIKETTAIYDEESDENNISLLFEKLELDLEQECNKGLSDPEIAEMKELRNTINDICYSLFDLITNNKTNISQEHITELREYIDDSLMWLYVHEKPTKTDYQIKIDEINDRCNTVFNEYEKKNIDIFVSDDIITSNTNSRNELENLCHVFKLLISDNNIIQSDSFATLIDETLTFIYLEDEKNHKDDKLEEFYKSCSEKIEHINNSSEKLYQQSNGINLQNKTDNTININLTGCTEQTDDTSIIEKTYYNQYDDIDDQGMDILQLVRDRQKDIMLSMINQIDEDDDEYNDINKDKYVSDDKDDKDECINDNKDEYVNINKDECINNDELNNDELNNVPSPSTIETLLCKQFD
jgi:heat shock protein 1/8